MNVSSRHTMNNINIKNKKLQKFTKKLQKLKKQNWEQIAHSYLSLNLHISSISFSQLAESIRYPLQHGFSQELCKVVGQHITDCMLKLFKGWGASWIHFSPPPKKEATWGDFTWTSRPFERPSASKPPPWKLIAEEVENSCRVRWPLEWSFVLHEDHVLMVNFLYFFFLILMLILFMVCRLDTF